MCNACQIFILIIYYYPHFINIITCLYIVYSRLGYSVYAFVIKAVHTINITYFKVMLIT
jgi:hypothetical protein